MGRTSQRVATSLLGLAILCFAPSRALSQTQADQLPAITDRDFTLDFYNGGALGSGRLIGMGGVGVALAQGSAGSRDNPAGIAIREATSKGTWDWSWHLDWLKPGLGSDFDNNGIPKTDNSDNSAPYITGGLAINYGRWGVGITIDSREGAAGDITPEAQIAQVSLGRSFADNTLTFGIASKVGRFRLKAANDDEIFAIVGSGFEVGGLWSPKRLDLRVGAKFSLPVTGSDVEVDSCDPLDCFGYIVPMRVHLPWRFSAGAAYRIGPTRWNRRVKSEFRDERALTLAANIIVTGHAPRAYGIEAYAMRRLQRSGKSTALSIRGGAEYEWLPGRLRVRAGSYWEPARFLDHNGQPISGRIHGTAGIDWRLFWVRVWGDTYRVRVSLIGDIASKYFNGGLSVGFW